MLVVNDLKDLGGSLGSISVLGGTQFPPSYFSYSSAYTWQKGGFLGINIQGCQKFPKVVSLVPCLSIDRRY